MNFNVQGFRNLLLFILVGLLLHSCTKNVEVYDLRCENLTNPLGVDNTIPHLSWKIRADRAGTHQQFYQLLVATQESLLTEDKADLWDTGQIASEESSWILYAGKELSANSLVYWKVRVWNDKDEVSAWSPTACFSVGLLEADDWTAVYLGAVQSGGWSESPLFRKTIEWTGGIDKALLHVNSLGYHEVYINGNKVSDYVLTPAVSQFDKRSLSVTYDVTNQLKKGANELVLWLSKGWYRDGLPGVIEGGPYVRAQLTTYADGSWNQAFQTDDSWLCRESGYRTPGTWRAHQFKGEVIHAAEVLPDLTASTLDKVAWMPVRVATVPSHTVSPQMTEPNKIQQTIHPVAIQALNDTTWLVDMGTNLTGWTEIRFPTLQPNQQVTISYCDFLNEDGSFREANQLHDYYIASGKGRELFKNKFNYHAYRYIRLSNLTESPGLNDISGHLIHTDYQGESTFSCSDEDLNAIHEMVHYTLRCISQAGYMVDCPHLERLGYGGDGNASTVTAQTMFDLSPLYLNWMSAWGDCMREDGSMPHTAPNPYSAGGGPYWCGFIITASWQTYVNYGDDRLLKRFYPMMEQWLEYVDKYTVDGLLKQWPSNEYRNWYLGDWATPTGIDQTDVRSVDLVNNCFVSQCFDTMVKIAGLLGEKEDVTIYQEKSDALKARIHQAFYDEKEKNYSTGTQIDLIYPMLIGATPEGLLKDIEQTLYKETADRFDGHLATGLVGVPIITQWAIENEKSDFMYQLLKKRTYPGYLYMLDNGATTTWEHWNGDRSHVHNCYNGIGSWFYQALAGIRPDEKKPGYRHVLIQPQLVEGITWVKATKDTPYGKLTVAWEVTNDQFVLDVEVPVGSRATITLPVEGRNLYVNGAKVDDSQRLVMTSGVYRMECEK